MPPTANPIPALIAVLIATAFAEVSKVVYRQFQKIAFAVFFADKTIAGSVCRRYRFLSDSAVTILHFGITILNIILNAVKINRFKLRL